MPLKRHAPSPAEAKTQKEKELRRVYRKLKGVRSELSVKMRKLRMESTKAGLPLEDDILLDDEIKREPDDEGPSHEPGQASSHIISRSAVDGAQYEIKSLIDQKNRLRKKFWKLQQEVHEKSKS